MRPSDTSNIARLPTPDSQPRLARVLGVANSYLRVDMGEADVCIPFTRCSTSIQKVQPGDRVLVRSIAGFPVVETRMMRDGEAPIHITADIEGNLVLEASGALCLRTSKAEILIDAKGNIKLTAVNIESEADEENRLAGRTIKLS